MPFAAVVLKAAAKMEIGLQENEKRAPSKKNEKRDSSKKKEKRDASKKEEVICEKSLKRQHARKALTNWLAWLKNRNRSTKAKVKPSASKDQ
jgi:hypothetical protein